MQEGTLMKMNDSQSTGRIGTTTFERVGTEEITLPELLDRAREIAYYSKDYSVNKANSSNVYLNDKAGLSFTTDDGNTQSFPISRYAMGQLGSKMGVPASFIVNCIDRGRLSLAQYNINELLSDYNRSLFIRTYKNRVRGILTNRYSECDSHVILELLCEIINPADFIIKGYFISEERLHLRLAFRETLPAVREDLFVAIIVDSSDVGRAMLTITFGIFKLVCTNGLIIPWNEGMLYKQKHIDIHPDEFFKGLHSSLQRIGDKAELTTKKILIAKDEEYWGHDIRRLIPDEEEEFVEHIRRITQLPKEGALKVLELMRSKYNGSRWGLINSITDVAHDYTLERRIELERFAGKLLFDNRIYRSRAR